VRYKCGNVGLAKLTPVYMSVWGASSQLPFCVSQDWKFSEKNFYQHKHLVETDAMYNAIYCAII